MTYSADYPEKCVLIYHPLLHCLTSPRVIISSIRDKGQCPCPRCLVSMSELEQLGTPEDMARRLELIQVDDEEHQKKVQIARNLILVKNHAIGSEAVEAQLKSTSVTPTALSTICLLIDHLC